MATCLVNPKENRRSYNVFRFPHARSNSAGNSTSWHAQEPPHGRLLAHVVDFGGRGQVTGDVVTSGVDFVDEGGKNTARATKDGYRLSLASGGERLAFNSLSSCGA